MKKLKRNLLLCFVFVVASFCFAEAPAASAKVRLNVTERTISLNKGYQLKLSGTKKSAVWTSSNKKIATVSNKGYVKAKKVGKCKITAKLGKKKYCCNITVKCVPIYTSINKENREKCGYSSKKENFEIPSGYTDKETGQEYIVTSIADYAFSNCKSFKKVIIPKFIKKIGKNAFSGCSNLESVDINAPVDKIDEGTFAYCSNLVECKLPAEVTNIGREAFYGCGFKKFAVPESVIKIGKRCFMDCIHLKEIDCASINNIYDETFKGCCDLSKISLSDEVYTIGCSAFQGCTSLEGFSFSKDLSVIDDYAFMNSGLRSVSFSQDLWSIGDSAFKNCEKLVKVEISEKSSFLIIGSEAFKYCNLNGVTIPSSVVYIGNEAFAGREFDDSSDYTDIDEIFEDEASSFTVRCETSKAYAEIAYAANWCLENVEYMDIVKGGLGILVTEENRELLDLRKDDSSIYEIPDTAVIGEEKYEVFGIAQGAFAQCEELEKVISGKNIYYIGNRAFQHCNNLSKVVWKNAEAILEIDGKEYNMNCCILSYIGNEAFYGCESLNSIEIPEGVYYIGYSAFEYAGDSDEFTILLYRNEDEFSEDLDLGFHDEWLQGVSPDAIEVKYVESME